MEPTGLEPIHCAHAVSQRDDVTIIVLVVTDCAASAASQRGHGNDFTLGERPEAWISISFGRL
jgi:hypothetical protein